MDSYLNKKLGEFVIVREVGRGGMGVVYEAEQPSLSRRVALKILPPAISLDPKSVERFHREAASAARLHHQNIVPIYSVGAELGNHFYAMEFIDGRTLAQILDDLRKLKESTSTSTSSQRNREWEVQFLQILTTPSPRPGAGDGPGCSAEGETMNLESLGESTDEASLKKTPLVDVPPREAPGPGITPGGLPRKSYSGWWATMAEIFSQIAEALDYAHGENVIHRDIKPSNIMLTPGGRPLVLDFGLALDLSAAQITHSGSFLGTPMYMSPEQAMGHVKIDHRTDVYSLGITLYELATLSRPFEGNRDQVLKQILFKDPVSPRRVYRRVPQDLATIIQTAIEKDPDRRYATAREFSEDLRRFRDGRPILAQPASLPSIVWKQVRRHRKRLGIAAVIIIALVLGLVSYLSSLATRQELRVSQELKEKSELEIARLQQEQAVDKLVVELKSDGDADKRSKAARALGQLEDRRAREALIAAARDLSTLVRGEVIAALGKLEDRAALPALLGALEDGDSAVRAAAAEALAVLRDPAALPALEAALIRSGPAGPDRSRLLAAIRAVAGRAHTRELVDLWKRNLLDNATLLELADASAVPEIVGELAHARIDVAEVLQEIGDGRAVDELVKSVQPENSDRMRTASARALAQLLRPEDVPSLVLAIRDAGWGDISEAIRQALRSVSRAARDPLEARIGTEDETFHELLVLTLSQMGYPPAAPKLKEILGENPAFKVNSYSRRYAIHGLRDLRDLAAMPLVIAHAGDPAQGVRLEVVEYLGTFQTEEGYRVLDGALDDPDLEVVSGAIYALSEMRRGPVVEKLKILAGHSSTQIRGAAVHALGVWGEAGPLLDLLRDEELKVRAHSADHIGLLRQEPAVPALVRALQDPASSVRVNSARALGRVGHPLSVKPLVAALGDGDPRVVSEAAIAIAKIGDAESAAALVEAAYRLLGEANVRSSMIQAAGRFRSAAVKIVLGGLASEEAADRKKAAELLGLLGLRSAVPALIRAASDPDPDVRAAAAAALGALEDPAAAPALIERLGDIQRGVREASLRAIGRLPLERAPREVIDIAGDPGDRLAHLATGTLVQLQDPETAGALLKLAGSDDPRVRREAAIALAHLGRAEAESILERELESSNRAARGRIARALSVLRTPRAIELLQEIARTDQPPVARAAIEELGSIDDDGVRRLLLTFLERTRHDVRVAAVQALRKQPAGAGVPGLLIALDDLHLPVLLAAREALQVVCDPGVEPITARLVAGIAGEDPWVRAVCAGNLRAAPSPQSIQVLTAALGDSYFRVRAEAAEALGWYGDRSVAPALRPLVGDPDEQIRSAAILALGRTGDHPSLDLFLAALDDPSWRARRAGAWALGLLGPRGLDETDRDRIVQRLGRALSDQDHDVRAAIAFALGERGGSAALRFLEALTSDVEHKVAAAAARGFAAAAGEIAVPVLLRVVRTGHPAAARAAVGELWRLGDGTAIAALVELLGETGELRREALTTLAAIHRRTDAELSEDLERAVNEEILRLRREVHRHPGESAMRNSLAWLLASSNRDLDEALRHARRAAYLDPLNTAYLDTLAEVHRARGEYDEARAVRLRPFLARSESYSPSVNASLLVEIERAIAVTKGEAR